MNSLFPFSFKSKWDFDIKRDNSVGRSDASVCNSVPKLRPGFKANGVYRQVDFSHRYHQVSLQREATNITKRRDHGHIGSYPQQLPNRSPSGRMQTNDLYKRRLLEVIKRRRKLSEEPKKDFKVDMRCSCKDDDCVELARDHLLRVDHPYKNPKPHDFRPVRFVLLTFDIINTCLVHVP